jgi:pseudouridine synthase
MADLGMCSRREAEALIERGLVTLNGKVVREMGVKVDPHIDVVTLLPKGFKELTEKTTLILYKPRGIASSRAHDEGETVYDRFPQFSELDIIGRLDKASEGLLLLSDNGVVARAVTGAHHGVEKEYLVKVREDVTKGKLITLEPGVTLDDGPTLPVQTKYIDSHTFHITLREGRKHQVRRMCEYLHLTVMSLKRVRIGQLKIGNMKPGSHRTLSEAEVSTLKAHR